MLGGGEPVHVHPRLGEDRLRRALGHAGHGLHQGGRLGERGHGCLDAGVEGGDVGVQGVDQRQVLREQEGVVRGQPAFDRFAQRGLLLPKRPLCARRQLRRVIQAGTQGL